METANPVAINNRLKLHPEWKNVLGVEFEKPYMRELRQFLIDQMKSGKTIYPAGRNIFNALNKTPPSKVKVVILGQDPYHGPNQAHGLCFSVQNGVPPPPSLINIFKELESDLGLKPPDHGNLTRWAEQGVLLINTCLTVERGRPLSHRNKGWERFTDEVIRIVSNLDRPIVFLLWGAPAQQKQSLIQNPRHLILKAPHPSPLSANRGFFGCKHFSKTNEFLIRTGQTPIDWKLGPEE